jgi:hypothetical protein
MTILSLQIVLVYGGLLCLIVGVLILGSLRFNARLWLQDYPAEIRAVVPPLTPTEKRQQRWLTIPFLLLVLGIPVYATHLLRLENGGSISFLSAYLNTAFILNLFNLFDAVVLDLLILTLMKPAFVILPGTEGMEHYYRNWNLQLRNFVKGVVIVSILSIPLALAGTIV